MRIWVGLGIFLSAVAGAQGTKLPPAPPLITGQPYVGERVSTSTLRLADGTTIQREGTSFEARNGQGWMVSRIAFRGDPLMPSRGEQFTTTIYDPNTRTSTTWCTCGKSAKVKHYGEPRRLPPEHIPNEDGMDVYLSDGPGTSRMKYHTEPLPSQMIMGIEARGSKSVRTIPAGVDGNDHDLTTTIESWYSPELKLALITIIDDPIKGLRKLEFRNLKRTEPDLAPYRVPPGYVLQDDPTP